MSKLTNCCLIILVGIFMISDSHSQTRERSEVPVEDTWKLTDLYASNADWRAAKDNLAARLGEFPQYQGKLAESPAQLLACLNLMSDLHREYSRLMSYASMRSDQDMRDSEALGMKQELGQLGTTFRTASSFIEPEIVAMDKKTLEKFIADNSELGVYKMFLNDIQRRKAHKLSEKEEKILAESSLMADSPYSIYSIFSNAELPYPEIKLSNGETALINQAGYTRYRAMPNRQDREAVFQAFFGTLDKFQRTLGTQLYSNVKKDMFYARTRGYKSCLESALDENNIPVEVYLALIKNVNENLDTFHRYLALKKRLLGVETLKYHDLYTSVVEGIDLQYSIEDAKKMTLEAMKPLGKAYEKALKEGFANRWIDVYPTPGKRSGAYSNGSAYDVHPYILLNFNGLYDDVSTLAHEIGHSLHSYFSNKTQPYPLSDYPIFVAEVASTFNEALLIRKQLEKIKDDAIRMSLLMNYLDGIKGTVFRQTQFAEFELRIHEKAERGEPLTGDELTKLYADIVKRYYGHDKGVCLVPEAYTVEWAYIPHFYYNFYVYQYATSFTASTALAEKVLAKEKGAVEKYIQFISSGGSKYPIDLLKVAGVDLTTSEPFQKTMVAMNRAMDEIEAILDKPGK
ncbi:oligoendopeptidase F [candidate division KSB1 bacterium]|nr:oligoendopeptidase F [candidate division KSB1 bacterium]